MTWLATAWPAVQAGAVTGLAIAMPFGAVGTMLVTHAARSGVRASAAAALGVASADGAYALVAALGGMTLRERVDTLLPLLQVLSSAVLVVLAALLLSRAFTRSTGRSPEDGRRDPQASYLAFLGLTVVNPLTLVYFCSVAVGLQPLDGRLSTGVAFAASALAASAVWQLCLVAVGLRLRGLAATPRGQALTHLVAGGLVLTLAVRSIAS